MTVDVHRLYRSDRKYFEFKEFGAACGEAWAVGTDGKAYLLMKPPFLAEPDAVADMERSIRRCADVEGCHTVSRNPYTDRLVESLC